MQLAAAPFKSQVTIVMVPGAGSLDLNSVAVETGHGERTEREGGSQGGECVCVGDFEK